MSEGSGKRALVVPGVREAEAWLAGELGRHAAEARREWSLLGKPVRVVVPSGPLRELALDRMLRSLGGAAVGVRVQTLWSLALEVLETAGTPVRDGALFFELAARRAVANEEPLRAALDGLEDGPGLAAAAISDLLSARLDSADSAAIERALAKLPRAEGERAAALIRAARATRSALAAAGRARYGDVYEGAANALEAHGERALAARALYVHGFAGATGQAAHLLRALLRREGARLVVVDPPGAADGNGSLALEFARRIAGEAPLSA